MRLEEIPNRAAIDAGSVEKHTNVFGLIQRTMRKVFHGDGLHHRNVFRAGNGKRQIADDWFSGDGGEHTIGDHFVSLSAVNGDVDVLCESRSSPGVNRKPADHGITNAFDSFLTSCRIRNNQGIQVAQSQTLAKCSDTQQIVNKAWNYAHVLRDDGLSYMAYTEQITFLLFLKMADELTKAPYSRAPIVPAKYGWPSLLKLDGAELETHYRHVLESLGKEKRMLSVLPVNLENGGEESKMPNGEVRGAIMEQREKPAFSLEHLDVSRGRLIQPTGSEN